jgi:hypothetical protein
LDFGHDRLTVGCHLKVGYANAKGEAKQCQRQGYANTASSGFWIDIPFKGEASTLRIITFAIHE